MIIVKLTSPPPQKKDGVVNFKRSQFLNDKVFVKHSYLTPEYK